jgi:hypothetical protein
MRNKPKFINNNPAIMPAEVLLALRQVLDYYAPDEKEDFENVGYDPNDNHISPTKKVFAWLDQHDERDYNHPLAKTAPTPEVCAAISAILEFYVDYKVADDADDKANDLSIIKTVENWGGGYGYSHRFEDRQEAALA